MGLSVAEAAALRGLHLVPVSFSSREKVEKTMQVGQKEKMFFHLLLMNSQMSLLWTTQDPVL
jgi:hypothetical protein